MSAAFFHGPVWGPAACDGVIPTRRTIEDHGGPRRISMALRAPQMPSVVVRGSPFFLRVETFAVLHAASVGGVLS